MISPILVTMAIVAIVIALGCPAGSRKVVEMAESSATVLLSTVLSVLTLGGVIALF